MKSENAMGFLQNFKIPAAQYFGKIRAIFQPVVGDFFEHISTQGFFDNLVGRSENDDSIEMSFQEV